ncbi:MAG: nucleotidyltransferase [Candidatus Omnitrophica bacterium]|nr:nucleotidyltransferase [Candidatus Omnitrophota bacterium]
MPGEGGMSRLEEAVIAIARFLEQHRVPYMVIGGVANTLLGIPRTTLDVDLTIWVSEGGLEDFVRKITAVFPSRSEDPLGFARETRVLPIRTQDGIHADIILGQLSYEEEAIRRAVPQTVQGMQVRVCSPEDLILHKIASERAKDREDVQGIIRLRRGQLDRKYLDPHVASLARELSRPDIQAWYEQCLREGESRQ